MIRQGKAASSLLLADVIRFDDEAMLDRVPQVQSDHAARAQSPEGDQSYRRQSEAVIAQEVRPDTSVIP